MTELRGRMSHTTYLLWQTYNYPERESGLKYFQAGCYIVKSIISALTEMDE